MSIVLVIVLTYPGLLVAGRGVGLADEVRIAVRQRSSAFVPGTADRAEVVLGDITRGRVRLGVRGPLERELVAPRSVREGDEVSFLLDEKRYTIRVDRLSNRLFGFDVAYLTSRREPASPTAGENDVASAELAIRRKLLEVLARELVRLEETRLLAAQCLERGRLAEARAALRSAESGSEEVDRALRRAASLEPRWPNEAEYLSLVQVRVERARTHSERISETGSPDSRALGRFFGRLMPWAQDIDAEILAAPVIGRAYRPNTVAGILHPMRLRDDLVRGRTLLLQNSRRETGVSITGDDEGRIYWLIITPPEALKAVPRMAGKTGRSRVVFALPAGGS